MIQACSSGPLPPLASVARVELSPAGFALILEYETGGPKEYNPHPEWPGASSGVTVGVGYDCGYYLPAVIKSDWRALSAAPRLAAVSGIKGPAARSKVADLRDILVSWQLATSVFSDVTVSRYYTLTARTFPGFEDLHPNARAALVSLVFNRGSSLAGPSRSEMRAIRDAVPKKDYAEIAHQLRAMIRLWRGTDISNGMARRREAEAKLVETP